jgi:DNA modification methylase
MAHSSENAKTLALRQSDVKSAKELVSLGSQDPAVWLLVLPFDPGTSGYRLSSTWTEAIQEFAAKAHPEATITILTAPEVAANLWPELEQHLRFQLWVAVQTKQPVEREGALARQHAALLVLTKYRKSLRHTTTRIGYTYCPSCDRSTKDYGGKKHTYNPYGTLMSDVWRDIDCDPDEFPKDVTDRLRDLFGLAPYEQLRVVDLRAQSVLEKGHAVTSRKTSAAGVAELPPDLRSSLINGDCMKALGRIPSDSVDFCFADPPYNLQKKYDNWNDGIDIREYFEWCDRWLGEMARVLKPGRTLAVLNIPLWAIRHFSYLQAVLDYQGWIVWEGLSLPVRMIMPAHYSIVCFSKGPTRQLPGLRKQRPSTLEAESLRTLKPLYCLRQDCVRTRRLSEEVDTQPITDLWWDIHRLKHNSRRVDHPCQLPPALMRRLIALFAQEGECVLDPFNGAGTTTLAAEQLNRSYIGIELSDAYNQLAARRHDELRRGLDPFAKAGSVPKAKNNNVKRLPKRHYVVPKKVLQLEVRRIAQTLGRLPSRDEVARTGRYPIEYYDQYFISWGEACAAARHAGMSETRDRKRRSDKKPEPSLFKVDI